MVCADRRRHHEFLDQGHAKELAETLKLVNVLLINDDRDENARRRKEPAACGAQSSIHGSTSSRCQARRVRRDNFFPRRSIRNWTHPFRAPALPIEEVKDPTGAGDSFAGGFMGYIASQGEIIRRCSSTRCLRRRDGFVCSGGIRHRAPASLTRDEIDKRSSSSAASPICTEATWRVLR